MPALQPLREELDAFQHALEQTGDAWQLHLIKIVDISQHDSARLSLVELLNEQILLENFATQLMHRVNLQKSTGTLPHKISSYLEIYHEIFHLLFSQSLFACQQYPYAEQDTATQELLQEMIHRAIFSITVNLNSNIALINTLSATDSDYDARVLALRIDSITLFLDFFAHFPLEFDTKLTFFASFSQNTISDLRRGLLKLCPAHIVAYQQQNADAATLSAIDDYERIQGFLFPHDSRNEPDYLTAQAFCQQARQARQPKPVAQEPVATLTAVTRNSAIILENPAVRFRDALKKLKPVTALTSWENTVADINRSLESCIEVFALKAIEPEFKRLDNGINELEREYYLLAQFSTTSLGPDIQQRYFLTRSALLTVLFEQGLLIFKKYSYNRQTAADQALLMLVIQAVLRATIHHLQLCDGCSEALLIKATRAENSQHFYQKGVKVFIDFLNGFPFEEDPAELLTMFSTVNSGKGALALQKKLFYFCEQHLSSQVAIAEQQIPCLLAQHDEESATNILVDAKKALNDFLRIIAIYTHDQQAASFTALSACKKQESRLDTLAQSIEANQAATTTGLSKKKKQRANQKLKKNYEKYTLLAHQLQLLIGSFQQFHTQVDSAIETAEPRLVNSADTFYSLLIQSESLFLTANDASAALDQTPLRAISQQFIATVIIVINLCYRRIQRLVESTPDSPAILYFSDYALRLFLQSATFFDKPHFDDFFAKVVGSSLTQQLHALSLDASLFEFCERQLIHFLKEDDLPAARAIHNHYGRILTLFKPHEQDEAIVITPAYAYAPSLQRAQAWGTSLQERELLKSFTPATVKATTAPKSHKKKSTQRNKAAANSKTNTPQTATVVAPPVLAVTTKASSNVGTSDLVIITPPVLAVTTEVSSHVGINDPVRLTPQPVVTTEVLSDVIISDPIDSTPPVLAVTIEASSNISTNDPISPTLQPVVSTEVVSDMIVSDPVITTPPGLALSKPVSNHVSTHKLESPTEFEASHDQNPITPPRATLTSNPVELPLVENLELNDTSAITANAPIIAEPVQGPLELSTCIYQQLLNDFPHIEEPRYFEALTRICLLLQQHPAIQLFIYGSFRHKKKPNDIDLLVLCDEFSSVEAFFRDVQKMAVAKTSYQKRKTAFHYEARVFDVGGVKIEFIKPLKAGFTLKDHCAVLDFTISAWHYNLRQLSAITYAFATDALARRRLKTMIDAETLFRRDPSIIFRAVHLIATEGYHLDPLDFAALQKIFANENIFMGMDCNKLSDEYVALFYTGHACSNLQVLQDLQLLTQVFPAIRFLSPWQQQITLHLLHDVAALIDARAQHDPINHWLMYSAAHAFVVPPSEFINPALFLPHIGLVWNASAPLLTTMDAPNKTYLHQKINAFATMMPPPMLPVYTYTTAMPSMQATTFHANHTSVQHTRLSGTNTRPLQAVNNNAGVTHQRLPRQSNQHTKNSYY